MKNSILDNRQEIRVNNIVATTSISDKLDLNLINFIVPSSEYDIKKFPGLIYRQNNPKTAVLLFSSGKMVCTGAKTLNDTQMAISKVIELLSKFKISLNREPNISVQNIVATSSLHTEVNLNSVAISLGLENVEYEPEQFPGLVYRVTDPKVVILIFSSGEIVCTGAKTIEDITKAVIVVKNELLTCGLIN